MNTGYSTAEVKSRFSEMLGRVRHGRERLVVLRRGKPVAALISMDDLHRLEALERTERLHEPATMHPIMKVAGSWADFEGADELLAEIYADREATGREIDL